MKHSKIIALLKPGKPEEEPGSYRPIALFYCYKLLERVIYNRISPNLFEIIPSEQAGFRPGRNCTDQVLAKLKSSVSFIYLSAAYDTVWREGLLYKFLKVIPCLRTMRLLNNMISNRSFQVCMSDSISKSKILNNGLAQGSVLGPVLFGLYISDISKTTSARFGYTDDWALATRHEDLKETEAVLTEDLKSIGSYFRKWRLQPNPSKTEVSCFHLTNALANVKLLLLLLRVSNLSTIFIPSTSVSLSIGRCHIKYTYLMSPKNLNLELKLSKYFVVQHGVRQL